MKRLLLSLLILLVSSPIIAQTIFTVNSGLDSDDGSCSISNCSFREAVNAANALVDSEAVEIRFNITAGTTTILLGSPFPSLFQPGLVVDALTQPAASCGDLTSGLQHDLRIEIDGSLAFLGMSLMSDDQSLRGLVLRDFPGDGVQMRGDRNLVECNYIGTRRNGVTAGSNLTGIRVTGSEAHIRSNLISANDMDGIVFIAGAMDGLVVGNLIGTTENGLSALANDAYGINIQDGAENNTIGGPTSSELNLISGNDNSGVLIDALDTVVEGNHIGLNRAGTAALANENGILVRRSDAIIRGNTISGNIGVGILISSIMDRFTGKVEVSGNRIGTNPAGSAAIGNSVGITLRGTFETKIGGLEEGDGNQISGNRSHGIDITDFGETSNFLTTIYGNLIGVNFDASRAIANHGDGIAIRPTVNEAVGFTEIGNHNEAARNIISGNMGAGIRTSRRFPVNTDIVGNYIGTDGSGSVAIPNMGAAGIELIDSKDDIIQDNVISGNAKIGILIVDARDARIWGNKIGTNAVGDLALGNGKEGIRTARDCQIGSTSPGFGNTIAYNGAAGIYIRDVSLAEKVVISSNSIYSNVGLGIDDDGDGVPAINDTGDGDDGAQNYPIIGQLINGGGPTSNLEISLASTPDSEFRIEIFSVVTPDPSGFGEGDVYRLGFSAMTDNFGDLSATIPVSSAFFPQGSYVSSTATLMNGSVLEGTSEFSPAVQVTGNAMGISLNARVFLQGAYESAGQMSDDLNTQDLLPSVQSYAALPWSYPGSESVSSVPNEMVDWVLVELRSGSTEPALSSRAGLLLRNGSIVDLDGVSPLSFNDVMMGSYYAVVRHRLHLDVMSLVLVDFSSGLGSYDFSTSSSKAIGTNSQVDLGDGRWALWSGDGNADDSVSAFDFVQEWLPQNGGVAGYHTGDFDMNGSVTAFDFLNAWLPSNGQASQVP